MAKGGQEKAKGTQTPPQSSNTIKYASSNVSHRVPIDVVMQILTHYATLSPSCAVNSLLISKEFNSTVEAGAYSCVSLFSVRAMEVFLKLIKTQPRIARKVNSLWIAPGHSDSDLITVLAPPTSDVAFEQRQKRVQAIAREILRSCRRLRHLALDGGFVTPQSATGFGTASKPQTLLCINPHSFLGNFSAPIFRSTIQRLEVVDTTLAVEEIDEIRQMNGLRKFFWTNPRAKADVTRDVSVLLRILSPRGRDLLASISGEAAVSIGIDFVGDTEAATQDLIVEQQERLMEALSINGTALPEKARINDKLRTICTTTSQGRAAALAATFKKIVENLKYPESFDSEGKAVLAGTPDAQNGDGEDDVTEVMKTVKPGSFYVDSSRANSTSIHPLSGVELQTRALTSLLHALEKPSANNVQNSEDSENEEDDDEVVEEWEALRDLVCQRKLSSTTPLQRYFANMNAGSTNSIWLGGPAANMDRSAGNSGRNSQSASGTQTPSHARTEEEVDGGRALQRIWYRWLEQVGNGELDGDVL
ncbi:uncharacterized protein FA14DRAFT_161769 [Meira miltonrushii]|uniref:Uncharacterized protein n=1 Tax=Meira miltonrushii TaxID=1280837 RepID=A0A316V9V2_9BASI|nr:uncharacterized protein FA14DRAFT_161769 [Meira miltonrushii]PWN34347.1 hypothetical protein FA14DRAFT_161769 [Meira miltonrushii]